LAPSRPPAPRFAARSIVSLGMFASYALSIARRSRGFIAGSAPPRRAATVTSLMSRVKILPFLASAAAFLCLTLAHLECPAMAELRLEFGKAYNFIIRFSRRTDSFSWPNPCGDLRGLLPRHRRSEEHTSELQSLRHLVCR